MVGVWVLLVLLVLRTEAVRACVCPNASVLSPSSSLSPSSGLGGGCCLNVSGSHLEVLNWSWFSNSSGLEILDLSHCDIAHIQMGTGDTGPSTLSRLFLDHNRLTSLPRDLLSGMFNLSKLRLEGNQITDLPRDFLQDQDQIQTLSLRGNRLQFLPASVLMKSSLTELDVQENPWHCSCRLLEEINKVYKANCSFPHGVLLNLTCSSPSAVAGRSLQDLTLEEVCRPNTLTPLFIALPLLILSALVLCWCCGRSKAKKELPAFSSKNKAPTGSHSNCLKPCSKPPPVPEEPRPDCLPQNQLLLSPSSGLLSSTRDLCVGEVEGRLDSSSHHGSSPCPSLAGVSLEGAELGLEGAVSVNVSEVLRDSADREKAYLTHTTQYYSLVPGLQLDDWEHGDLDNVDLT